MWVLVVPALWRAHLGRWSGSLGHQDLPEVGSGPLVACSLLFVRFPALLSVRCLQIWLYFAF